MRKKFPLISVPVACIIPWLRPRSSQELSVLCLNRIVLVLSNCLSSAPLTLHHRLNNSIIKSMLYTLACLYIYVQFISLLYMLQVIYKFPRSKSFKTQLVDSFNYVRIASGYFSLHLRLCLCYIFLFVCNNFHSIIP